ncbi:MAG: hypothetical protein K2Y32_13885 [Candidatus Obscuribacterales bacterium]|nr:hypothetical protein [Candidatus Obscuribacterales bacterium]
MTEVDSKLTKEERRKALEEAEKAEFWQSVKALYIPFSLFIACCIFAAGVFLVYYNEPAGWGFIGTTVVIAISAFIALFRFQNKFRAKGIIPNREDEKIGSKEKAADKVGGAAAVSEEQAK